MPFPTTSILRDFTQANGSPSGSSVFAAAGFRLDVLSNQLRGGTDSAYTGSYWATTYSGDIEHYIDYNAAPIASNYYGIHFVSNGGDASPDGYKIGNGSGTVTTARVDNGVDDATGWSTYSPGDNDGLGLERVGTTIRGYTKSGSTWTQRSSKTDATYAGAMQLAIDIYDPSSDEIRLDNQGGGVVVAAATGLPILVMAPPIPA